MTGKMDRAIGVLESVQAVDGANISQEAVRAKIVKIKIGITPSEVSFILRSKPHIVFISSFNTVLSKSFIYILTYWASNKYVRRPPLEGPIAAKSGTHLRNCAKRKTAV